MAGSSLAFNLAVAHVEAKHPDQGALGQTIRETAAAVDIKWWRRRELNPRPWQTNQPRLHA